MARGMLRPCTAAMESIAPSGEQSPSPPPGYIVSFLKFHERGLAMPVHNIFRRLLFHCQIELRHLNPNGIQHISTFVALCEGFLGIPPIFDLWRYFFAVSIYRLKSHGTFYNVPAGCASVHLRQCQFIKMGKLKTSNKGWHK